MNNFLTSGHQFSDNESLLLFRFSFLNVLLTIVSVATFLNLLVSLVGVIDFGEVFEISLVAFLVVNISVTLLLRKDKSYYRIVVSFFLLSSLILFYFVLFTRKEDEFRLISFFGELFLTYVLLGKNYGVFLALIILASIVFISQNYELEVSSFGYSTFFTFFIISTGFLHFFLSKVERDAKEFEFLNDKLKEKVNQEALQRMEQEQMLLHKYRMASMGEMIDSIAHQWRQPLMHINSILLNMGTAFNTGDTTKNDNDYLNNKIDEVATLTSHMSQTIEDFRDLFKNRKEYTNFTLKSVVDDVLALLKNNLNVIEVECYHENDVAVCAHKSELMQVIIIIISNAVEVLNYREIENKKITINIKATNSEYALISIEDNAGGIGLENNDVIFDPYFTTKEQLGGTGLGLYIAKIIVEHNMEGTITASNIASGAKFTISLARKSLRASE